MRGCVGRDLPKIDGGGKMKKTKQSSYGNHMVQMSRSTQTSDQMHMELFTSLVFFNLLLFFVCPPLRPSIIHLILTYSIYSLLCEKCQAGLAPKGFRPYCCTAMPAVRFVCDQESGGLCVCVCVCCARCVCVCARVCVCVHSHICVPL